MKRSSKRRSSSLSGVFKAAFIVFAAFAFLVLYLNQLNQSLFIRSRHQAEIDELEKKYRALCMERLKYEKAINKLYKDEYIEIAARKQLRMIKPDEKYYIVIYPDSSQTAEKSLLEILTGSD